jgi:hypothetical protein
MAKSKKQQAAIAVSMKKQGKVPAGKKKMAYGGTAPTDGASGSKPMVKTTKPIPTDPIAKKTPMAGGYTNPNTSAGREAFRQELEKRTKSIPTTPATKPMMKKGGAMKTSSVKMKMGGTMKKKK